MPTTLDLREGRMDVLFRPGNSDAVQLVFPTGALTGITLAALINGVTLPITQVADTVTLTPTSVQSALIATGVGVPWTLSIVGGNVLLSGRWIPHFDGTATNDRSTVVVLNGASVAVTVLAIGSGGGGGGVTDGDKGDIVVSGGGSTWIFDSAVVTAFAKTLLDDPSQAAMRTTLGLVPGVDVDAFGAAAAAQAFAIQRANHTGALTGDLPFGGFKATGMADGVALTDGATVGQFNAALNAKTWKDPVDAATTGVLPAVTYNNGAAGVGATLSATANGALPAQDGVTLAATDSLLVKNQATGAQDGIYVITQLGTGGTPFILTRRTDADTSAKLTDATTLIDNGTNGIGDVYTFPAVATIGTSSAVPIKSGEGNTIYGADGVTVQLSGITFSVLNGGIGVNQLAAAVAGNGLVGGAGSALAVVANVDGTIVVNADDIQVGSLVIGNIPNSLITYAKIQNQAQATFLMRAAGSGSGAPIAGTVAQAITALGLGTAAFVNTVSVTPAEYTASFTWTANEEAKLDTTSATPIVGTLPVTPLDGTVCIGKWTKGTNATATMVCGGSAKFNTSTGSTSATFSATNVVLTSRYQASGDLWILESGFSKGGLDGFYVSLAGSTSTGQQIAPTFQASGNTGANTNGLTLTGANASGAPTTGAHVVGEIAGDNTGKLWYCTVAGTPGTWVSTSGSGGGMATDPLWNAPGDIPYATADNTGAILAYVADGKVLGAVSGLPAWVDPRGSVIVASHVDTTVVNSTTETTVASLSLPGGAVAADDELTIELYADSLNNSGGSINYTFRWKFGSTTVMSSNSFSIATNANREKWDPTMSILMESTTAQRCKARFLGSSANTNSLAGFLAGNSFTGYGTAAEDTSTAKNVILTVQMNTANAAADFVCHGAVLKLNKKR